MSKVMRFGVSINQKLLERFDKLISKKGYANRSEAIRDVIRDHLVANEWERENVETVGTITIIYDHKVRELTDRLTDFQHKHYTSIISSMHVHLDEHNCLEVLVVKGRSKAIRGIADRLIGIKGVRHGKLVMTSTGKQLV